MIQFASAILFRPPPILHLCRSLPSFPFHPPVPSYRFPPPATYLRAHLRKAREFQRVGAKTFPERVNPCVTYRDCLLSRTPLRSPRREFFLLRPLRDGDAISILGADRMHLGGCVETERVKRKPKWWGARERTHFNFSRIDMRQLGLVNYRVSTRAQLWHTLKLLEEKKLGSDNTHADGVKWL